MKPRGGEETHDWRKQVGREREGEGFSDFNIYINFINIKGGRSGGGAEGERMGFGVGGGVGEKKEIRENFLGWGGRG